MPRGKPFLMEQHRLFRLLWLSIAAAVATITLKVVAWALILTSSVCLIAYAASWEVLGRRLIGLEPRTSLLRPWEAVRYVLDFLGRALFVTVLGADLLLRATVSAWRHQREFLRAERAREYDRLMEKLDRSA